MIFAVVAVSVFIHSMLYTSQRDWKEWVQNKSRVILLEHAREWINSQWKKLAKLDDIQIGYNLLKYRALSSFLIFFLCSQIFLLTNFVKRFMFNAIFARGHIYRIRCNVLVFVWELREKCEVEIHTRDKTSWIHFYRSIPTHTRNHSPKIVLLVLNN